MRGNDQALSFEVTFMLKRTTKSWITFVGFHFCVFVSDPGVKIACLILTWPLVFSLIQPDVEHYDIARRVLESVPLIDGHNDLADNLRKNVQNQLKRVDLNQNLSTDPLWGREACPRCFTDLVRLKAGQVGAQFWASRVLCVTQYKDAVAKNLEQMDVIKRFVQQYSNQLRFVTDARGIEDAFAAGVIGSLIGVEGGHSIDSKLAVLRLYYQLGARYLTLTHFCTNPWADSSLVDDPNTGETPQHNGLTDFGKTVVREMNRLGMMVDLSHVSNKVQLDAIATSRAPVIFSHSNSYTLCNHHRNVHDDVLQLVKENNGIVMVNFYNLHLTNSPNATIEDVVNHINYIRNITGVDHVGIGADFDGIEYSPVGLEDTASFPNLFARLAADPIDPWTEDDLRKLAGLNFLRVFRDVERVRDEMEAEGIMPYEDLIPEADLGNNTACVSGY